MKHSELPPEAVCHIYGHGDTRWLPLVGPLPLPQDEEDRPSVLLCLYCNTIIDRST